MLNMNITYQEVPEPEPANKCIFSLFFPKCSGINDKKYFFPSSSMLGQNKLECLYFSAELCICKNVHELSLVKG
jgi:hypothetical protein